MDLNHLIAKAQNLPNIPKVVQELIESFNNDDVDSDDIADKLSKDQAMTAKVLRMANSSRYGGHRQVGSVNDAVVLLGFNALRTLVLASGLTGTIKAPDGFNMDHFWKKGFTIASISKWLASFSAEIDNEIAFTCGMLHDIGGLLTHILVNDQAIAIDRVVAKGADRVEMEHSRLGFSYPQAGAELANRWKFPEAIVAGIRHQLEPQPPNEAYQPLAGIMYIAHALYEHRNEAVSAIIEQLPLHHIDQLQLDKVALIDQIEAIKTMENDISEFIG